jgi:hypothetical protein
MSTAAVKGDRVQLDHCADPHTHLTPGATGTVVHIDSLGTVHVAWDNGPTLGLVPDEDHYTVIK